MKALIRSICISLIFIGFSIEEKSFSFEYIVLPKEDKFKSHVFLTFISKTELCIGTPFQCKKVQFDPGTYITFILATERRKEVLPVTAFNKDLSSTYRLKFESGYIFSSQKIISASHSIDKLKFGPIEINEGEFFYADDWVSEHKYSIIGLKVDLKYNTYVSFIDLLINNTIIDSREYTIERTADSGMITFGKSVENNNRKYKKILRTPILLEPFSSGHFTPLNKICIDNLDNVIDSDVITQLDESFGLIQMPENSKDNMMEYYLKDLNCKEESYLARKKSLQSMDFYYFICPKEKVDSRIIKHEILFSFKEGTIPLRKEDAFMEYNSTSMIFAVIFKKSTADPQYIIGEPVLKYYRMRHNFNDLTFTFYSKSDKGKEDSEILSSKDIIYNLLMVSSTIVICGLCLVAFVFVKVNKMADFD